MEILEVLAQGQPIVVAILIAWNITLQKEVESLRSRLERVSDRVDKERVKLVEKLTRTDLGEGE